MELERHHLSQKGEKTMTSTPIIAWFSQLTHPGQPRLRAGRFAERPSLRYWAEHETDLPHFVRQCPAATRYLRLLGPLAWDHFPEDHGRPNGNPHPLPYAALAAACLVKLDQQLVSMGALRWYLVDHPALVWLFGFPRMASDAFPWGFDADASLPTQRHFTRLLREVPNAALQFLLDSSVASLQAELAELGIQLGECMSMDTKHILAWVKENNPKAYIKASERYDKTKQPTGDPDCRLGCKRRHNQRASSSQEPPPTPAENPVPAGTLSVGEYYWGYASGVAASKVPGWGEFVLAELTQPFDQPDVAYFFPLMAQVERRLGFRPKFGAFDAAFDAFYVYEYFHRQDEEGFAAVPFSERGGYKDRQFSSDGAPICQAGLPMALKYTFVNRSGLIEHDCQRYVCPLRFPKPTGQACPQNHPKWAKGGCGSTLAASIGARLRYQLDRESEAYHQVYKQRTASERINSQAVDLRIERPKLRNGQAIANQNTLTYILINLHALQRLRQRKAQRQTEHQVTTPDA
jgi:hypothetical protein